MLPSKTQDGNKYFSIEQAAPYEIRNTLLTLFAIAVIGLLNVYLTPLEYFFNDVLGVESINGCPLLTFAGIPCPMCGMGRVFSCLTDFYIARSFYYNPLGLVFYIIFGFVFGIILILSIMKKKIVLKKPTLKLWFIPVLFIVLMWILNILFGHHFKFI